MTRRVAHAVREVGAPIADRPRERLLAHGPNSLGGSELLAVVLGAGSASGSAADLATRLLREHDTLANLARADPFELAMVPGIGRARAAQLAAAFELGRRSVSNTASAGRWVIRAPRDVADRLAPEMAPLEREELRVLALNTKNVVLRSVTVYQGNVSGALVRIAELFRDAIRISAAGIVVVHNHPSGRSGAFTGRPSANRRSNRRRTAARYFSARPRHRGGKRHVSLRDRGVGFERS